RAGQHELRLYACARRPVWSRKRKRIPGLSLNQGGSRFFRLAVPGSGGKKPEFRSRLAECGRLLVLFHGWREGLRRPFSYLLCDEGARQDRTAHGVRALPQRDRARHRLLSKESVRCESPAAAVLEAPADDCLPQRAL